MSKVFRAIGTVAGVVATVAAFIPGGQGVAAIAAAVSAVSTTAAQLTARPPTAQGQINSRILGANNPQPYLMGRSYSGGVQVHDVGYGGKRDDVNNPYRFMAVVYSCCGPVQALDAVQFDYVTVPFSGTAATGYYDDYFWRDFQLGARPEGDALAPRFSGAPDWGSSYKLSGFAAIGYSFKWSKKGKRFTGGQIPAIGAIWRGVKVYDPRLDSTFPGGAGTHRITDEGTWAYSANPALHALAYAYGRYVNGIKVFGADLGAASIDLVQVVAWANVCDANDWELGGTIYEPGDKWNNLKRICEAGGAQPVMRGGVLGFDYQAPRTSLGTINIDDLADGTVTARVSRGWKDRVNTLVPRYRSEAHQWNYVQSAAVTRSEWVTADGEEKIDERQWDLVQDKDQVAQLATYDLFQRREAGPITFACKPHMRAYGPGDCLTLGADIGAHPDGALKVVIRRRTIDAVTGVVSFEAEQETDVKHSISLTGVGTLPPIIGLPTVEEIDEVTGDNEPGIITERFPAEPTPGAPEGSLYFDELGRPFRKETGYLFFGLDRLVVGVDPLLWDGYVSVQDRSLRQSIEALQSVDDDGLLTIDEKIRIAIPDNGRLEAQYQGILTQATGIGLSITALTTARSAWIALRDGLTPAWNDTTQPTPITRGDWDAVLNTYRVEIENAQAALALAASVTVIPPAGRTIVLDPDGAAQAGQYPFTLVPVVKRGGVDITLDDDTSYAITPTGITATVENTDGDPDKGDITVTAGTGGSIALTVTVGGVDFGPFTIALPGVKETTASFSTNTYSYQIPLADGKIALQQGGTDSIGPNRSRSVTFAVPYEVEPVVVVNGNSTDLGREGQAGLEGNPTTTGFTYNNNTADTIVVNWHANGQRKVTL